MSAIVVERQWSDIRPGDYVLDVAIVRVDLKWCTACALNSVATIAVVVLRPYGVRRVGTMFVCTECKARVAFGRDSG